MRKQLIWGKIQQWVNDGQQAVNGWSAKREKLPLGFFFCYVEFICGDVEGTFAKTYFSPFENKIVWKTCTYEKKKVKFKKCTLKMCNLKLH